MAGKNRTSPQVSIRGETYRRVREYCLDHDVTVVAFISNLCKDFFEERNKAESKGASEHKAEIAEEEKSENADSPERDETQLGPSYIVQKAETDARFGIKKKYEGKIYIEREVGGGRVKTDAAPLFGDDEKKKWKP